MSDDLRAGPRLETPRCPAEFVQRPDPALEAYAEDFLDGLDAIPTARATVGCIIPAYNEAETIAGVLDSLLQQTRLPDVVHLIVNNTSDESVEIASHYAGSAHPDDADRRAEHRHLRARHRQEPRQEGRRAQLRLLAGRAHGLPAGRRRRHHARARRHPAPGRRDLQRRPHRRHLGHLLHRRLRARGRDVEVPDRRPAGAVLGLQHAEPAQGPQHGGAGRTVLHLLHPGAARRDARQPPAHPLGQRLRGGGLAALAADQVRRLPDQDLGPRPRPRRRDDHAALPRRPAGEVELRRHRPDVARAARRHEGPALPPQPAAALVRAHVDGHQHDHALPLRGAADVVAPARRLRVQPAVADPARWPRCG